MSADLLAEGVAWSPVVDDDVERIVSATDSAELDAWTVSAFLLAAHRRVYGADLRAHMFRIRSAYLARRLELDDVARARADARSDYPRHGGYAALPWPPEDPWAAALPEPCI